jgi:hypothetical protein
MIRPVPDFGLLPGTYYALDRHLRGRNRPLANFVIAPEFPEPQSRLAAFLSALRSASPTAHTWICEDRWTPLGLAQARVRPGGEAWDLAYLCAFIPSANGQSPAPDPDDVIARLVEYALDAAVMRGVHRFFARVADDCPELELFGKLGFQRYARDLTYWLPSAADGRAAIRVRAARPLPEWDAADGMDGRAAAPRSRGESEAPVRGWHRYDAWGLARLYDAATPRRVQVAESQTTSEFLHTRAGGGRTWCMPLVEPRSAAWVVDRGVRLGGWLRLRHGRGSQPHQLWLMAHPDDPDAAAALLRHALDTLAREEPRPVVCQVREYEGAAVDALRAAGFEHGATHALLVRHLTMRALRKREAPALEPRVVYGVKGLGTTPSRYSKGEKTHYAARDH